MALTEWQYRKVRSRNQVIEECARIIEGRKSDAWSKWADDIAKVIRNLKGDPRGKTFQTIG